MCQRRISHGTCFEGGIRRKIKEEERSGTRRKDRLGRTSSTLAFPIVLVDNGGGVGKPDARPPSLPCRRKIMSAAGTIRLDKDVFSGRGSQALGRCCGHPEAPRKPSLLPAAAFLEEVGPPSVKLQQAPKKDRRELRRGMVKASRSTCTERDEQRPGPYRVSER